MCCTLVSFRACDPAMLEITEWIWTLKLSNLGASEYLEVALLENSWHCWHGFGHWNYLDCFESWTTLMVAWNWCQSLVEHLKAVQPPQVGTNIPYPTLSLRVVNIINLLQLRLVKFSCISYPIPKQDNECKWPPPPTTVSISPDFAHWSIYYPRQHS